MYNVTRKELEMEIINDFIEGRIFNHWYDFFISKKGQECGMEWEDYYKKNLVYNNLMNNLVEDIAIMCPVMETFENKQDLKEDEINYLKSEMEEIDWASLSIDIVKDLETKGDVFFQVYFDEHLKKHRLLKLKSENMLDILPRTKDNPPFYIYKDSRVERTIEDGIIKNKLVNDIIVFTEGSYTIFYDVSGLSIKGARKLVVKNTKQMESMIPIIHIRGKEKRKNSEFSKIPCVDYIDGVLYISAVNTDIRIANKLSGSPRLISLNAEIDLDTSVLDAGGVINFFTPDEIYGKTPNFLPSSEVKSLEITNSLSSLKQELDYHMDSLYRIVGLIPPTLQSRMSTSDSSKAIAQFRTKQEVKNKTYMKSIRNSFAEFFALLLRDKGGKSKKRNKVYLEVPKLLVTSGVYDELLLNAQEVSMGLTTVIDILKSKGYTDKQINSILDNRKRVLESETIVEENSQGNNTVKKKSDNSELKLDISDTKTLDNDNKVGIDNRMKK